MLDNGSLIMVGEINRKTHSRLISSCLFWIINHVLLFNASSLVIEKNLYGVKIRATSCVRKGKWEAI